MLMPDITTPKNLAAPQLAGARCDLESLLSLSLIRTHTKTDDVPHVTDEQLKLYRQTAFEVCEKYTGMLFTEIKVVTESVAVSTRRRWRRSYKHRMQYPSADGKIYLYGSHYGQNDRVYDVASGTREIEIEHFSGAWDASSCCAPGPCSPGAQSNYGMKIMYRAGRAADDPVPGGILVGCLKYIAWSVMNPGDEFLSVQNKATVQGTMLQGTNNSAWASGAIEQWRIYVDSAI